MRTATMLGLAIVVVALLLVGQVPAVAIPLSGLEDGFGEAQAGATRRAREQAGRTEAPDRDPSEMQPNPVAERLAMELQIAWRDSTAVGEPWDGRLEAGVQLPPEGQNFFTWDAVHNRLGNPDERRWGTDDLILTVLAVLDEYRAANPGAPRVGISDLSRPEGGRFGREYGGLGHRSHQNGLDVDIAYPRRDRRELGITDVDQIDLELAQDLVDRFVAAGVEFVFIGPNTGLAGPSNVVQPLRYHDDHMHVRIRPADRDRGRG